MKLIEKLPDNGGNVYYTAAFRQLIEDHLEWLKVHSSTKTMALANGDLLAYQYNLSGLLLNLNIPRHLHWIILRVNGFVDDTQFTLDTTELLVPDAKVIDNLRQRFTANHTI